jgi:eukaryotic-like serine/threonine-protein kinase
MKTALLVLVALGLVASRPHPGCPVDAANPALPATQVNRWDGAEMVLVSGGWFLMGTNAEQLAAWQLADPSQKRDAYTDELPQRKVWLDDYYIYTTEVTVAQYRAFCVATGHTMPPASSWTQRDDDPIVWVSWDDAAAYAAWAQAALPTEAQWEKAARGTDGRAYPWGNDWDPARLQHTVGHANAPQALPVGSFPTGASPYGCLDMAGNVWEWCADWYDPQYYRHMPDRNPTGPKDPIYPNEPIRVVRGGGWNNDVPGIFRVTYRGNFDYDPPTQSNSDGFVGFRCVVSVPQP